MSKINIDGLGTALITPFRGGEVDYEAYGKLVARQIEGGVDFLVPLGTTGETPCLDDSEKIRILELTAELAGDKTVVAGVGTNSLKGTIGNIRTLENHGVDVFLVVVPYYNKPTQRGQYEYFKAVAGETDKPIILYNVPGRTGANMTAETALRLAEIPNIVATKEASGNLEQIYKVIDGAPQGFKVLSGNDDQTLDIMFAGGAGIISVASNIAPRLMAGFVAAIRRAVGASPTGCHDAYASEGRPAAGTTEGKTGKNPAAARSEAEALNSRLMPLFNACFVESNPIPAKAALAAMGLIENELRLPLVPGETSTMETMKKIIADLDLE